jgi:FlaA1/EpsC-like NDP-sugar epimerase
LRAGEKLHEVVISADEARRATLINSVYGVDFEHYVIKSTDATVGAVRGEVSSRTARKLDPNVLKGMLG